MSEHVLLVGHGTVRDLDDLPAFLSKIRRGRPTPDELVREVRRRYEAIGGHSPLLDICQQQAAALQTRLGRPVHLAMRLWDPLIEDTLRPILQQGCDELTVIPLAPYSAPIYTADVAMALAKLTPTGGAPRMLSTPNWGHLPQLILAFATEITRAMAEIPEERRETTRIVLSAHSLPLSVIAAGDPYADEFRSAAVAIIQQTGLPHPHCIAFQSQGMTRDPWLGPDLPTTFAQIADEARGEPRHVLLAPTGFLTDHIEILYDIDIEAQNLARDRGLTLSRTRSLNDSPGMIDALEAAYQLAHQASPLEPKPPER